jgi:hypothetical protein
MPFTLAHPAIILPLSHRYFHFPALVFGSMSPDFIYYLSGKPADGGHTIFHSEWLNLPLCLCFYAIYVAVLKVPLWANLPQRWSHRLPDSPRRPLWLWLLIFLFSAWVGMLSHIFLDNFTHGSGTFVRALPFLQQEFYIPMYKWCQYGGTVLGLVCIAWYLRMTAKRYPHPSTQTTRQKSQFWLLTFVLSSVTFVGWNMMDFIPLKQHGIWIVRAADCFVMALFIVSLPHKFRMTSGQI